MRALGAKPEDFLPSGKWPGSVSNSVILLSYDQEGRLIPSSSKRSTNVNTGRLSVVRCDFRETSLAMLESVGPIGYVIRTLNQVREKGPSSQSRFEAIEIIEAVILALVAVATAWSGYQQHSGRESVQSSTPRRLRLRVTAEGLVTLAGQERIYDSDTFNSWVAAKLNGKEEAAEFFERRFRDEYRPAFAAWLRYRSFQERASASGPNLHARVPQRQARAVP